jgi:hypothetical protein
MEVSKDRQCGWAWWEFLLVVFVDIRENSFDDKKNCEGYKDGLQGDFIIHGKEMMLTQFDALYISENNKYS